MNGSIAFRSITFPFPGRIQEMRLSPSPVCHCLQQSLKDQASSEHKHRRTLYSFFQRIYC